MASPAQAQALLTQFNALSEATLSTYYTDCFLCIVIFIFFHCNLLFFHCNFLSFLITLRICYYIYLFFGSY